MDKNWRCAFCSDNFTTACCYYSAGYVVQVVWNCCQYHVHTRSTYACMWVHLQDLSTAVQSTTSTNLSTGNVLQSLHKFDTNVRGSSTECIYLYFLLTMLFRSQNSWKLTSHEKNSKCAICESLNAIHHYSAATAHCELLHRIWISHWTTQPFYQAKLQETPLHWVPHQR